MNKRGLDDSTSGTEPLSSGTSGSALETETASLNPTVR
jgi:hypothetical protein